MLYGPADKGGVVGYTREFHAFLPANSCRVRYRLNLSLMMISLVGASGSAVACFHFQSAGAFLT
jgi:hypothetical protein